VERVRVQAAIHNFQDWDSHLLKKLTSVVLTNITLKEAPFCPYAPFHFLVCCPIYGLVYPIEMGHSSCCVVFIMNVFIMNTQNNRKNPSTEYTSTELGPYTKILKIEAQQLPATVLNI
jgi:hypothetical protein